MELVFILLINIILTAIALIFAGVSFYYALWWWVRVNRSKWILKNFYGKLKFLEIKLPKDIDKSPAAFELVLNGVHQSADYKTDFAEITKIKSLKQVFTQSIFETSERLRKWYWDGLHEGKTPMPMSLEIASIGGELHFYIVCVEKYKQIVESYIYSQYPGVEIKEVEDYLNDVRPEFQFPGSGYEIYTSTVWALEKSDYLPIKTYVDYKLDKDPKEEYKIDPLTPLLESMANIGPDERVYYQVQTLANRKSDWTKAGQKRIDQILKIKRDDHDVVISQDREMSKVSLKEKEEIEKIQRNIEKPGFECSIKVIYASKDKNNKTNGAYFANNNDQIIRNSMKSFANPQYNSFKLENQNAAFPWMDFSDARRVRRRRGGIFFLYERRNTFYTEIDIDAQPLHVLFFNRLKIFGWREFWFYFWGDVFDYYNPNSWTGRHGFVLNSEELATIYHFPGQVLNAPKVNRVDAQKSDAPVNLPI